MEASPEFYGYFDATHNNNNNNCNHFMVDELLDFSKEDDVMTDAFFDSLTGGGNSGDSSPVTAVDSCNSSSVSGGDNTTIAAAHFNGSLSCRSFTDAHFPGTELCVPYDDLAELEWLSNFMEDSVSSDDAMQGLQFIPTGKMPSASTTDTSSSITTTDRHHTTPTANSPPPIFPSDVSVPGKARSKRSRAAPGDWSSRLLVLSPATSSSENDNTNPTSVTQIVNHSINNSNKTTPSRSWESTGTQGRRCLHCGSEKTPQWRTGPMGPKTLCNACGVRYKSGRLVPEYRPAASPTFVSTKHSNSHRKVMELRRQKDLHRQQQEVTHQLLGQTSIFGISNGGDDYSIHHHQQIYGPDYTRHMV